MGIGRFVYTPILPDMISGVPLSPAAAGAIASANFLGYLVGALAGATGWLKGAPRLWFLTGLALSTLTTAAIGLFGSVAAFVVLRFAGGAASALVLVFSSALVLDRLQQIGRPRLSALHFAGVGTGIAFSATLIGTLHSQSASWQQLWFASGAASLVLMGLAWLCVPGVRSPKTTPHASNEPAPHLAWSPALIRLVIAYGLFGFGYVITATFISVIAADNPHMSGTGQLVWLIVGLAAAPSIFLWNRVTEACGSAAAFSVACLLEALGVALTVSGLGPAAIAIGAALLGGTFMGLTALGLTRVRLITENDPTRMLALMTASFGLGQMAGPSVAGALRQASGSYTFASLIAAAALLAAAALVFRSDPQD
ncbi:YbfB/YjiJ family MFS transporter [Roseibium sp. RKSG952]|nr:YbfB/YjiJ family MFS transporter [Roseibium sp. RKSG952]